MNLKLKPTERDVMGLILVEMLLALGLAVFIVWWTMFHRPKEERTAQPTASAHSDTERSDQ